MSHFPFCSPLEYPCAHDIVRCVQFACHVSMGVWNMFNRRFTGYSSFASNDGQPIVLYTYSGVKWEGVRAFWLQPRRTEQKDVQERWHHHSHVSWCVDHSIYSEDNTACQPLDIVKALILKRKGIDCQKSSLFIYSSMIQEACAFCSFVLTPIRES